MVNVKGSATSARRLLHAAKQVAQHPKYPQLFQFYQRGGMSSLYFALNKPWFHQANIRTVIDIGAHVGHFALTIRQLLPESRIYSFEPIPASYRQICSLLSSDPLFTAFNTGIGAEMGKMLFQHDMFSASSSFLQMADLHKNLFPQTGHTKVIEVEMTTLDEAAKSLVIDGPLLIKVDVQGYEDRVLSGGEAVFKRASMVIIETSFQSLYLEQPLFDDIYIKLRDWGFIYSGCLDQMLSPDDGRVLQQDSLFLNPQPLVLNRV